MVSMLSMHRGHFGGSAEGQGTSAGFLKPCHQILVKHLLEPGERVCHRTLRTAELCRASHQRSNARLRGLLLVPLYYLTSCVAKALMTGLYSFPGQAIKKSGLPAGRKVVNAGKTCFGMAVRGACLPYTVPVACIRIIGTTAGSIATYGLEAACNAVSEMPLMGEVRISPQRIHRSSSAGYLHVCKLVFARLQGKVLADLSEEDLKEAYRQVGLDFQVPNWMWLELRNQVRVAVSEVSRIHKHIPCWVLPKSNNAAALDFQGMTSRLTVQDLRKSAEHDSACRIQKWYREQKQRKQYDQNVAAKELRQQGKYMQTYLLQKVSSVSFMHKLGIGCTNAVLTISTWRMP